MAIKIAKFTSIFLIFILIFIKNVNPQQPDRCEGPGYGCPDLVCKIINSRETDFCEDIECAGVTAENCIEAEAFFVPGLSMCGCCPGCAKYIRDGEPCEVSPPGPSPDPNCKDPYCPILRNECNPETHECRYLGGSSKVCAPKGAAAKPPTTCFEKRELALLGPPQWTLEWIPSCEKDGTYSAKQCKGTYANEGFCFCVDEEGKRIFGREWMYLAENMTCGCSRQVYHLRNEGNIAAIHCSSSGSYEPLQCDHDSGVCYCVDPDTGKMTGAVIPEHQWKQLPCFHLNLTNGDETGTYLRICESEWVAGQRIQKEGKLHGLKVLAGKDELNCDYDGAYGPKIIERGVEICVNKVGLGGAHRQLVWTDPMDCQCYRDSLLYLEEGREFSKTCQRQTGNYDPVSIYEHNSEGVNRYSCVDIDGAFFGDIVGVEDRCCLLNNCPITNPPKTCNVKSCWEWLGVDVHKLLVTGN